MDDHGQSVFSAIFIGFEAKADAQGLDVRVGNPALSIRDSFEV